MEQTIKAFSHLFHHNLYEGIYYTGVVSKTVINFDKKIRKFVLVL